MQRGLDRLKIRTKMETIQITVSLRSARIMRRVLETWGNSSGKPSAKTDLKKLQEKKKRTCKIVDFAVPADHRIKPKESKTKNKYLSFARELKKLWNIKVTIIRIVIGAFATDTKVLLKGPENLELRGRVGTIQTAAFLRTARILRRVLETWEDLLSLKLPWKIIS